MKEIIIRFNDNMVKEVIVDGKCELKTDESECVYVNVSTCSYEETHSPLKITKKL